MSRFKIINLIDKLFVTCAVFLIVFAWINFYLRDLWITFVLSLIFSFAIMFVFYYFCNKKQTKKILNKQQIENINTQFYIFKLNSITQKLKLIQQILSKNFKPEIKDNSIFYVDNTKKIMVIIKTKHPVIDHNILLNIIEELNTENFDELHIICDDIDLNIDSKLFNNKEIKCFQ